MFKIGQKLDQIIISIGRLIDVGMYLIKVLQHTNRVLDPSDSKNPYKLRKDKVIQGDFGVDPVNIQRRRGK
tara:strand:- start:3727 stop:3939 length:213 start_codon:yes stop_codon:yes gene_type:complete